MDRLQAMKVFLKVAESGGFAGAARQLKLNPPAVTRAIASLEAATGARLFIRTTRTVKLSDAGRQYVDDCRRILADLEEADAMAAGSYAKPAGTLTVTCPVMLGHLFVLPILMDYLGEYPAVTGRAMLLDRITNLVDEGIDIAIRIGHLPPSELTGIPVGFVRRVICAAPSYLQLHGCPTHPDQLAQHTIISIGGEWATVEWRFGRDESTVVSVRPRLFCNTDDGVLRAALAGQGIIRLLSYKVTSDIGEGKLQTLLDDFEEEPMPIHLVHAEGRRAAAKVRAFIDMAVPRLRASRFLI